MTNSIKIGSNSVSKFYVGSIEVDKIYLGNNVIYQKTTVPDIYTINISENGRVIDIQETELPFNIADNGSVIYRIEKNTDTSINTIYLPDTVAANTYLSVGQSRTVNADGYKYTITYNSDRIITYDKSPE